MKDSSYQQHALHMRKLINQFNLTAPPVQQYKPCPAINALCESWEARQTRIERLRSRRKN
jgi:hypothetical protein